MSGSTAARAFKSVALMAVPFFGAIGVTQFMHEHPKHSPTNTEFALNQPASREVAAKDIPAEQLPHEPCPMSTFPQVPPAITRKHPARLVAVITTDVFDMQVTPTKKMEVWGYNQSVPGPFLRARQGDLLEIHHINKDKNSLGHNIDFHCVTGPGGGAPALYAEQGEEKIGYFRLLQPGLYVYHCAAAPVPVHVARGMFGLILVEPEDGLPPVDKEFCIMQSEIYGDEVDNGRRLDFSYEKGLDEKPTAVVFNGREGALTESPLVVNQGDRVRIFAGNAGPNLVSSFHMIGSVFDRVYRDGDLISAPARGLQIAGMFAGGSTVVEFDALVPGNYTFLDHSIFRLEKGCVGFVKVLGQPRKDIYASADMPVNCAGCKLHN